MNSIILFIICMNCCATFLPVHTDLEHTSNEFNSLNIITKTELDAQLPLKVVLRHRFGNSVIKSSVNLSRVPASSTQNGPMLLLSVLYFAFVGICIILNNKSSKLVSLTLSFTLLFSTQVSALTNELLTVNNDKLAAVNVWGTGWYRPAYYLNYGQQGLVGAMWEELEVITDFTATGGATITGVKCDDVYNSLTVSFSDDGILWDIYDEVINNAPNIFSINPTYTHYAKMYWNSTGPRNIYHQNAQNIHAQFVGIIGSKTPTVNPTDLPTVSPTLNPTNAPTNNPTEHPTDIPTKSPTLNPTKIPTNNPTLDGCDFDINSYLDKCYCSMESVDSNSNSAQIASEVLDDNNISNQYLILSKINEMKQENSEMINLLQNMRIMIIILFGIILSMICVITCVWNRNKLRGDNNNNNKTYGKVSVDVDGNNNDNIGNDSGGVEFTTNQL